MGYRRSLPALGLIGLALGVVEGGIALNVNSNGTTVVLSPYALLGWPLLALSVSSAVGLSGQASSIPAPWWRCTAACLYDYFLLLWFLGVPACAIALVLLQGGLSPWTYRSEASSSALTTLFIILFPAFWILFGMPLHPRVRSPGAQLLGLDIRVDRGVSIVRLAIFGPFAYFGLMFPLFGLIAFGVKPRGTICAT